MTVICCPDDKGCKCGVELVSALDSLRSSDSAMLRYNQFLDGEATVGVVDRKSELFRDGVNGPCKEVLLGNLEDSWC